jgi:hypothetical protein
MLSHFAPSTPAARLLARRRERQVPHQGYTAGPFGADLGWTLTLSARAS